MTASTPRKKNEPATPFQCPCKYFAGAFYYRLRICSATARRGENRSKSYFILGIRRKKFPNSNPKAKSAPTLYFSRNFPLFPAISRFQTHPSNITGRRANFRSTWRAFRAGMRRSCASPEPRRARGRALRAFARRPADYRRHAEGDVADSVGPVLDGGDGKELPRVERDRPHDGGD